MEFAEKVEKYKVYILGSVGVCVVVSGLVVFVAPRFVTIVAYFWPLLLSTALFLVAVLVFARTTAVSAVEKPGEGLLDYVAGDPHHHHHHHLHDDIDHHKVEASTSSNNNESDN